VKHGMSLSNDLGDPRPWPFYVRLVSHPLHVKSGS
jgi:hypothetical protein